MSARLYTLSLSHPALASQLALERKGIEHELVELLPGLHALAVRALGFEAATVPALRIDDERVQGSLQIARYLEQTHPEPALYPSEPEMRSAVERAERWGESELQPVPRRILRFVATRSRSVRRWMAAEVVGMPLPGVMAVANKPVASVMARRVGADAERVRADVIGLGRLLDEVDRLIAAGTIGGEQPNAADLQILTTVRSLQGFSDLAPLLAARPAVEAAERLIPPLPGPVPPALPGEWLQRAQATTPDADRRGNGNSDCTRRPADADPPDHR